MVTLTSHQATAAGYVLTQSAGGYVRVIGPDGVRYQPCAADRVTLVILPLTAGLKPLSLRPTQRPQQFTRHAGTRPAFGNTSCPTCCGYGEYDPDPRSIRLLTDVPLMAPCPECRCADCGAHIAAGVAHAVGCAYYDEERCPRCGETGTMKHGDERDCRSEECMGDKADDAELHMEDR